jgi:hypothetical protein
MTGGGKMTYKGAVVSTPHKTMAEIRDAEAEKHGRFKFIPGVNKAIIEDFKAGFDCRDKLGDEELNNAKTALLVAKEVMSTYDDQAVYKCQLEIQKLNKALNLAVEALEYFKGSEFNFKADDALAEIRKLQKEE